MTDDRAQHLAHQAKHNHAAKTRLDLTIAHGQDAATRAEQAGMRRQAATIRRLVAELMVVHQHWPVPVRDRTEVAS
jgi:hypothetical protein